MKPSPSIPEGLIQTNQANTERLKVFDDHSPSSHSGSSAHFIDNEEGGKLKTTQMRIHNDSSFDELMQQEINASIKPSKSVIEKGSNTFQDDVFNIVHVQSKIGSTSKLEEVKFPERNDGSDEGGDQMDINNDQGDISDTSPTTCSKSVNMHKQGKASHKELEVRLNTK